MARILIAEDEHNLNALLADELRRNGHEPVQAYDGREALEKFAAQTVDLAILDVMLPHLDGFEVCRQIRAADPTVAIMMLTARDSEIDRVVGLEVGADDYVVKPFSVRELMARVKAHLRRSTALRVPMAASEIAPRPHIEIGDCVLDPLARTVAVRGLPVALSRREFDLLEILMRHPQRVLTREWLLETVWGDEFDGNDRTVDTHVLRLREKIGRDSAVGAGLIAVRGIGYRLEAVRDDG
jgi:two-component system, OmpR family, response regulator RegX3